MIGNYSCRCTGEFKVNGQKNEQISYTLGRPLLEKYQTPSAAQRDVLEQVFARNPYPTRSTRQNVAEELGMGETKVYNWFAQGRKKMKAGKIQDTHAIGEFVGIRSVQL